MYNFIEFLHIQDKYSGCHLNKKEKEEVMYEQNHNVSWKNCFKKIFTCI